MSPHGIKGSSKKGMGKGVSMTFNGPRMSSKKKRKLANENSDPEVMDRTAKYWHGLKIDASDDIKEKILKHLAAPSRRYKLKDEDLVLPAKKKRKLQKNGSLETDSDEEKNSKKGRLQMKKKQQYGESPSSKLRKWKKLGLDSELAAMSGTKNKSKKSVSGDSCGKGKKATRQKLLSANYEDMDGVCIYDLDTPELKNKARKKKLMAERAKGANHLLNKKKVRVGKGVLTAKSLAKKQKATVRIDGANFKLLPKKQLKQLKKLKKRYSVQMVSDVEASDSDNMPEKNISGSACKKNRTKMTKAKWADLNKKKAKFKKQLQDLEITKSKKLKRQQVSEEEADSEDDDFSSEEEDVSDEYILEDEEDDIEDYDKDEDDDDEEEEDDDDDDSSDDQTSDEKSGHILGLSKRVWVKRHDDKAVVILKHPFQCHLVGTVKLSVLSGCINILGAKLTANGQWHNLYSPSSHMLLKLTTEHPTGKDISQAITQLSSMFSDTDQYADLINPSVVVLLVCDINWGFSDYITTLRPYQKLFQRPPGVGKILCNRMFKPFGVSLLAKSDMVTSASSSEIDRFLSKWPLILKNSDYPKILLCGGKKAGKSTFARTLINIALETKKAVCLLDCDPGQTEFTPPGCVSLNVVKQFILGPPFCHQQDPAFNVFFGEVSPDSNSNHYMMCVRSAIHYYLRMPERLTLIINTMGWIKGPGKKMLDGILNMVPPDHVVLLDSVKERVKPFDLLPKNVIKNQWHFHGETSDRLAGSTCNWELTVLKSVVMPDVEKITKLSNAELRSLSILSYLGKNWSPGVSLNHTIPYKIKWGSLAIHVCQEIVPPSQILYAVNASVVALCIADLTQAYHHNDDENLPMSFQKRPICKCLGFGFVRGIHVETQMLYIVSPLPLNIISQVNTLLRGPVYLPLDRLQTQDVTDLMYVDKTLTKTTGSQTLKKRHGIPRRN